MGPTENLSPQTLTVFGNFGGFIPRNQFLKPTTRRLKALQYCENLPTMDMNHEFPFIPPSTCHEDTKPCNWCLQIPSPSQEIQQHLRTSSCFATNSPPLIFGFIFWSDSSPTQIDRHRLKERRILGHCSDIYKNEDQPDPLPLLPNARHRRYPSPQISQ